MVFTLALNRFLYWLTLQPCCPRCLCGYMDDLAAVLRSDRAASPILVTIFEEFARINGLRLNLAKTIFVPT